MVDDPSPLVNSASDGDDIRRNDLAAETVGRAPFRQQGMARHSTFHFPWFFGHMIRTMYRNGIR